MVQSMNGKALITLASVIRRPYLASPHIHVPSISDLNFTAIRNQCGIRAVVFDKDNTLTAPYETDVHPKASSGLKDALKVFGPENVAILSNSAGTKDDPGYEDALKIEEEMGITVIRHDEKKPGGLQEVLNHFDTVDDASQLCMVGDRLLTDVVFGNLFGMLTVHVLPLCEGNDNKRDNKVASVIRSAENAVLYKNWWGSRMVRERTIPHAVWSGEVSQLLIPTDAISSSSSTPTNLANNNKNDDEPKNNDSTKESL